METAVGLNKYNLDKLRNIATLLKQVNLLFIAFGHFNLAPETLAKSGFLALNKSKVLLANDCEVTCNAGSGSVID